MNPTTHTLLETQPVSLIKIAERIGIEPKELLRKLRTNKPDESFTQEEEEKILMELILLSTSVMNAVLTEIGVRTILARNYSIEYFDDGEEKIGIDDLPW